MLPEPEFKVEISDFLRYKFFNDVDLKIIQCTQPLLQSFTSVRRWKPLGDADYDAAHDDAHDAAGEDADAGEDDVDDDGYLMDKK